ncbi:sulfotransferase domain-containing protein [Alphaproteobacteria bacterium KMM 3653]|uniref:Sulfotransferase domain-containing protein n=1 Tax=Harenicola maris TaxID=2841044 RepID=A0AAP2CPE5_9RHOB|nr:sulfotransferase domain-containing protein [Harenicola maris]
MTTARFICIGTHHKTGTIWMRKVWRAISNDQEIPFMQVYRPKRLADLPESGPQICVNWSSSFPRRLMNMPEARFIHIIRDPRDVLLSGMRYHRVAPLANEKFLRIPNPEWGGMTYQKYINALETDHERLIFEMENKHHETLEQMLKWPYGHEGAADIKYEDLIEDTDCAMFRGILEGFAIEGLDIDRAVQSYWDLSLFGGLKKDDDRSDRVNLHVNSGAKAQWVRKMPREIAEIYAERYADALKTLGYAEDSSWVETCRPAAEIEAAAA